MCEHNRMYVQRGLELRAIKRRDEAARVAEVQREAAQQAAERRLHADVNFRSKWTLIENEAAQANLSHDSRTRDQRAARRAQAAKRKEQWHTYLERTLTAVGAAAALNILHAIGGIELWIAAPGMILAAAYTVINCVAFTTRNKT